MSLCNVIPLGLGISQPSHAGKLCGRRKRRHSSRQQRFPAACLKTLCWKMPVAKAALRQSAAERMSRIIHDIPQFGHQLFSASVFSDSKRVAKFTRILFRCLEAPVLDSSQKLPWQPQLNQDHDVLHVQSYLAYQFSFRNAFSGCSLFYILVNYSSRICCAKIYI